MIKRSKPPLIEPLNDSEFEELDDILLSEDLPEGCMDAITLEGFLTAHCDWAGDGDPRSLVATGFR